MKYLPLLWSSLWRKKVRTVFTLLSIFVAFLLFGLLMTIKQAFSFGVEIAGLDRLVLIHKVSLIMPLPVSYLERLRATEGVALATHQSWFGGVYQDPANFFAQMAVERESFLEIYPEFRVPPDQLAAWAADRQGAIVGVDLAKRFNWKIGDRIPIQGTIWQPKGDGQTWEFNIVGMYDGDQGVDKTQFFFRYDYLDENRRQGDGLVGWYVVKIADPGQAQAMAAKFDDMFANSSAETKTTTEKGFVEGFAKQVGDIGAIMVAILVAVLFTMLLVAANTMAQSVRERTSEVGVLKTLGFSNGSILALVLGESVLIAVLGGAAGLGLAWLIVQQGDPTNGMLPIFQLPGRDVALGGALIVLLGLVAGALPAATAMNLKITDALRRG
jgi:putative ABC transport system permease protein